MSAIVKLTKHRPVMQKGRKTRPGGPNTHRINLHVNDEEDAMLTYLCEADGQHIAVVLRGLIRKEYLRKTAT